MIYEVLFYSLTLNVPAGTNDMVKSYYDEELIYVSRQFKINAFHYHYYRIGASELDHLYFLRNANEGNIPVIEVAESYPEFSTQLDYTAAKFIAYENLQIYLLDQLTSNFPELEIQRSHKNAKTALKWTGDAINLVELAYGIWLTGQLNNGNAGIAEIVQFFEMQLQVNIGRPFRRWQFISGRKRVSQVKYIEEMRKAV